MGSKPAYQLTMTHRGVIHEYGSCTKTWRKHSVKLRETNGYWISELGVKFRKKTGMQIGINPLYELALESIERL